MRFRISVNVTRCKLFSLFLARVIVWSFFLLFSWCFFLLVNLVVLFAEDIFLRYVLIQYCLSICSPIRSRLHAHVYTRTVIKSVIKALFMFGEMKANQFNWTNLHFVKIIALLNTCSMIADDTVAISKRLYVSRDSWLNVTLSTWHNAASWVIDCMMVT